MADIQHLFSERALENEEYRNKIILPTEWEFNQIKRLVDVFPDLISIDYVPIKFLGLLGDTFGYPYLETEDPEVQREIFKHLVSIYKEKGSLGLFEKALHYSHDPNYALGDMTYYHGDIEEGMGIISFPRDKMFQYDVSHWDIHKWSDKDSVALGIIDIEGTDINSRTETYLDELIPAGIKYQITVTKDIGGDKIIFPFLASHEYLIEYHPTIPKLYVSSDILRLSVNGYDNTIWDGREVVSSSIELESRQSKGYFLTVRASDRMYKPSDIINNPVWKDWTPAMADFLSTGGEL